MRLFTPLALTTLLAACAPAASSDPAVSAADGGDQGSVDSGGGRDTGGPVASQDGGDTTEDASPPGRDAGSPKADAGTDAGSPKADAGTDAGSPKTDAGTDAGSPKADAGTDAGSPKTDGGTVTGRVYDEAILTTAAATTSADLDALRKIYVFFGHQSVGGNILEGIDAVAAAEPKYAIVRKGMGDTLPTGGPALVDKFIGNNGEPDTKINAFSDIVPRLGSSVRIALMKLCYVDIIAETNAVAVAQRYVDAMKALEQRQPGTIFVYTTVPLGSGTADDVTRNAYNAEVRRLSAGKPLYDLASLEASRDGKARCTFVSGGKTLDRQCDEYSAGDPHLNGPGGERLGKAMLLMLADLARR